MKKYIKRSNEKFIFESFERPIVSALLGPRGVGKTTLIDYYIKLHPERLWVTLDWDGMRMNNNELEILIEQGALQKIGGDKKIWVFIDEAQKCPGLFDQIKIIYDKHNDKDCVKFILAGSARLNLHQFNAIELLHLREFSIREMSQHLNLPSDRALDIIFNENDPIKLKEIASNLMPFRKPLQDTLEEHLVWGGLPAMHELKSDNERLEYLSDYLQTYLEKDVRDIDDLKLFQNVMKMLAHLTGSVRDDESIIDEIHCSNSTLNQYRNYLLATWQYIELYPFRSSYKNRLEESPKGYIINNGLISFLTGNRNISILETFRLIKGRFENWLFTEIQSWLDTSLEKHDVSFWSTFNALEVDFVVTLGNKIVPFEVVYGSYIPPKKLKDLKTFMQYVPKDTIGVICYLGPLKFDNENRILFLPAWMM